MTAGQSNVSKYKNTTNVAWSLPIRQQHQQNAEDGKYGGPAKKINDARKKKQKILDEFLNN